MRPLQCHRTQCFHGQPKGPRQRTGLDIAQGEGGHPHKAEITFHEQRRLTFTQNWVEAATSCHRSMVRSFRDHNLSRITPMINVA